MLVGRGGTAEDILSLANTICDPDVYVAAPQAAGNSWYPHSFIEDEHFNEPDLSASVTAIKALIDEIAKTIPEDKIFIAGFSYGACLSF